MSSLSQSCHILKVSWAGWCGGLSGFGVGQLEIPRLDLQNHLGSLSRIHVPRPAGPPDTALVGLRQGLGICILIGPPMRLMQSPPLRTHCPGTTLLPLSPLCLVLCQSRPGTVAEVCVNTPWAEQASFLRYAISSPKNNTLF